MSRKIQFWTIECDETGNYVMDRGRHVASVNEQSDLPLVCAAPCLYDALEALAATHRWSSGWEQSNLGKIVEGALSRAIHNERQSIP
jgi:hypothetical protein